jgi:hypothetical protein
VDLRFGLSRTLSWMHGGRSSDHSNSLSPTASLE